MNRWNDDFQNPYTINQPLPICIVWHIQKPEIRIPSVKWNECLEYLREYKFAKLEIIYAMNVIDIDSVVWYGPNEKINNERYGPTNTYKNKKEWQKQRQPPQKSQKSWMNRLKIDWFRWKRQKEKSKGSRDKETETSKNLV